MRQHEIEEAINKRRRKLNADAKGNKEDRAYPDSDGEDLVGLALSGGGIRSAMFNLGLLQSLQRSGFLKHVDYISSVSGGGYTNGYYSTLGHTGSPSEKDEDGGLSAKDAQFLLDGQYLNRPTEFMTDYLLKTALIFGTVFAWVIFLAAAIAIYFRAFDDPQVRRWLGLLDLNSDLRVGIFASVLLIAIVLVIRGVFRSLQRYCNISPSPAPGRWAIIAIGILLLGCAIMIGNGDFFISDSFGFLPEKIDLKSLQLPIAVAVLMLFLPLMRVGNLIRSERITASVWQRLALWLVLSGATWGAFLVAVGYIGQENLSGVINHRPPQLLIYDIFHYERLAALLDDSGIVKAIVDKNQYHSKLETGELLASRDKVLETARMRNALEKALRKDNYTWDTWLDIDSDMVERWTTAIHGMTGCDNDALKYVKQDHQLYEIDGKPLLDAFNRAIRPESASIPSQSNEAAKGDSSQYITQADRNMTRLLLIRAAKKALLRTDDISEGMKQTLLDQAGVLYPKPTDHQQVSVAFEILSRWLAQGANVPRKSASDPPGFRDQAELRAVLEVLAPSWTNYSANSPVIIPRPGELHPKLELLTPLQHWQLNRLLLEIAYPEVFKERRWTSTSVTIAEDQKFRTTVLIASGIIALVGLLLVDINHLSPWFLFYRKRVYETFIKKAGPLEPESPLHSLDPCEKGFPYPLFVGGLMIPHAPAYRRIQAVAIDGGHSKNSSNINPSKLDGSFGSQWYSFLMSPLHVGWMPATTDPNLVNQKTYRCTKEYLHGGLTLSDAIVLSGAAVSTFMASNPALRVLMQVFNIRLEQWLPNPVTEH
ncbi:MAG: hypothetical protein ACKOAU_16730, partial [Pirellula sp.]